MILLDGKIYMGHGHNNGLPMCLEMESGRVLLTGNSKPWKVGAGIARDAAGRGLEVERFDEQRSHFALKLGLGGSHAWNRSVLGVALALARPVWRGSKFIKGGSAIASREEVRTRGLSRGFSARTGA